MHVLCVSLLGLWVYLLGSICSRFWFDLLEVLDCRVFFGFQCFGLLGLRVYLLGLNCLRFLFDLLEVSDW